MSNSSSLTAQPHDDGSLKRVWGGVPLRNPAFVGRDALLLQLKRHLPASGTGSVLPQALHGIGGVGKTQIALEYAHRYAGDYDIVWWIPADQPAQTLRSLADLGRRLGGPDSENEQRAAGRALEELASTHRRWLLIYDNAGDPESLRDLIPATGNGHVIVTSRNPNWATAASGMRVEQADPSTVDIAICYSHDDVSALDEIHVHLTALRRESSIRAWDDRQIRPGAKWRAEIERTLSSAAVVLLLVSPEFLASDFVMDEEVPAALRAAEERGTMVVSVILRPCLYERFEALSQFQAFNSPGRPLSGMRKFHREQTLVKLVNMIADALR